MSTREAPDLVADLRPRRRAYGTGLGLVFGLVIEPRLAEPQPAAPRRAADALA